VLDEGQRMSEPADRANRRTGERASVPDQPQRRRGYQRERGREREGGRGAETGVRGRRWGVPIEWRGTHAEPGGGAGSREDRGRAKSAVLDRNVAISCARATRTGEARDPRAETGETTPREQDT